ncbi:MAG: ribonuclease P protein component [Sedimenticola sp.]|nr:ribonuclease P protein component [Sedimenticola sp.]
MQTGRAKFGRDLRLLKPAQFRRVFQNACRSSDRHFTVLFLGNDQSRARLGTAIAKKVLKRAVDRNRVKRVVRESFRIRQRELAGLDLVVMCGRGIGLSDTRQLRDSLERHWSRAIEAGTSQKTGIEK